MKRDSHTLPGCEKRLRNWTVGLCKETFIKDYSKDYQKGYVERWGAGVETQKNVRGEIGGWGRVPFNEPYAPLLSTIYDGA